jgi:hypothetical protein
VQTPHFSSTVASATTTIVQSCNAVLRQRWQRHCCQRRAGLGSPDRAGQGFGIGRRQRPYSCVRFSCSASRQEAWRGLGPSGLPDRPARLSARKTHTSASGRHFPSRAPESLPSIRTPANKRRCYLHEHLLIQTRCFGATAWSRRAPTPLSRSRPRPTPATPRTRRWCPEAGHRRRPKRSSRLHDGGGFEEQKP